MSDNFDRAVEHCYNYLGSLFEKGITRKDIESTSRSEMLGVFDDDFDWHTALANQIQITTPTTVSKDTARLKLELNNS